MPRVAPVDEEIPNENPKESPQHHDNHSKENCYVANPPTAPSSVSAAGLSDVDGGGLERTLIFLPMDDFKLAETNSCVLHYFLGVQPASLLISLTYRFSGLALVLWLFGCTVGFTYVLRVGHIPPSLVVASSIPAIATSILFVGFMDQTAFKDTFSCFDTYYSIMNNMMYCYLLGLYLGSGPYTFLVMTQYFFSYSYGALIDMFPFQFRRFESKYSKAIDDAAARLEDDHQMNHDREDNAASSSAESPPANTEGNANPVQSSSHINFGNVQGRDCPDKDVYVSGTTLASAYSNLITLLEGRNENGQRGSSNGKKSTKKAIRLSPQTIFVVSFGAIFQLAVYLLIKFNYWDSGDWVLLDAVYIKWTIRELLIFTCANVLIFATKRVYSILYRTTQPNCYRRGLVRIPLVSEWMLLMQAFIKSEMESLVIEHQDIDAHAEIQPKVDAVENNRANINSLPSFNKKYFSKSPICMNRDMLVSSRLVGVFGHGITNISINTRESLLRSFLKGSSKKTLKVFRYIRLTTILLWFASCMISTTSMIKTSPTLDKLNIALSVPGLIEVSLFLVDTPLSAYKHTFSSFESAFMMYNILSLCFSIGDFLQWAGFNAYLVVFLLFFFMFQNLLYDTIRVPWKRIKKNLSSLPVHTNLRKDMPFTYNLLSILYSHYVFQGLIDPEEYHDVFLIRRKQIDLGEAQLYKGTYFMTLRERMFYHKIMGFGCLGYYAILIVVCIFYYVAIVTDLLHQTKEREINMIVIQLSNTTIIKASLFNITIFGLKRLSNNILNPMISNSITMTYHRVPLVPSFVSFIQEQTPEVMKLQPTKENAAYQNFVKEKRSKIQVYESPISTPRVSIAAAYEERKASEAHTEIIEMKVVA